MSLPRGVGWLIVGLGFVEALALREWAGRRFEHCRFHEDDNDLMAICSGFALAPNRIAGR
jgi:hypothetical protein